MMTKVEIELLKLLISRLPDEKWEQATDKCEDGHSVVPWVWTTDGASDVCCTNYRGSLPEVNHIAEFIASARQALPAALETIEEQRRRIRNVLAVLRIEDATGDDYFEAMQALEECLK